MGKKNIEETVEKLCKPITDKYNLELIDVEYKKEGPGYVLRATIDKPSGVTIDDCEAVSRELSDKLDEVDPIEGEYNLEVQSPGERNLRKDKEYNYFKGRDVEVKFYQEQDGRKTIEGKLEGLENGLIKIILENGEMKEYPKEKVANVKLKINF